MVTILMLFGFVMAFTRCAGHAIVAPGDAQVCHLVAEKDDRGKGSV